MGIKVTEIKSTALSIRENLIEIRRHLHKYPELSFHEKKTAAYISDTLTAWDIPHASNIAGHGIVVLLKGAIQGEAVVALRADIDALPIMEANTTDYVSQHEGVMHACGHDVHTTALLGALKILKDHTSHWAGTVKAFFQPAEEKLPGGASLMIEEGVLENPKPTAIFGQHVHPPLSVGKVGVRPGMYMASADEIYLTIHGKGGHAALPHELNDPIVTAAQVILQLQQITSRHADPTIPTVLSFGKLESKGGATNVITSEVKITGTFRTMNEAWRSKAHRRIEGIIKSVCEANACTYDLNIMKGYPFLMNDAEVSRRFKVYAIEYLGAENVVDLPIRMTSEDFAFYSQKVPACFYRLGTGNIGKGITSPVHSDTFDVDEDCLPLASGLMAWNAIQELKNESKIRVID